MSPENINASAYRILSEENAGLRDRLAVAVEALRRIHLGEFDTADRAFGAFKVATEALKRVKDERTP